jgi:hypothetical protein
MKSSGVEEIEETKREVGIQLPACSAFTDKMCSLFTGVNKYVTASVCGTNIPADDDSSSLTARTFATLWQRTGE